MLHCIMTVNDDLDVEPEMTYFKVLSQDVPGQTEGKESKDNWSPG